MDNNMVWNDQTARILRQGEMIEAANARRSQAVVSKTQGRRFHHSALSQIGKTLSTVGGRLQDRYDSCEEQHTHRRDYWPSAV